MGVAIPGTERLFFAVVPGEATREQISGAAAALHLEAPARLVPRSNYHVTLAFVGEVAAESVPILRDIGARQQAAAFSMRFDRCEYWPKPEVVVAAARGVPAALEQLWLRLHRDLKEHGWAANAKRLRPHVTLAKKVVSAPALTTLTALDWDAREFCLMRSDASGQTPAYTVVDTWQLLYDREVK